MRSFLLHSRGRAAGLTASLLAATLSVACSSSSPTDDAPVHFVDGTREAGLSYVQSRLMESGPCLTSNEACDPEYSSGGVAIGDVDGDGQPDVFVTRLGQHDLLFLNRGGRFEDASAAYGLSGVLAQSNGAALFDADRDGDLDLYVTVIGAPGASPPNDHYYFFDNQGGRFVEAGDARGLAFRNAAGHGGTSIAVGDYDRDGWPDLHLTEWRVSDGANIVEQTHERLLHNRGAAAPGHFEDVTLRAGVFLGDEGCRSSSVRCIAKSFASTFTDLDDDGWPDLAIASDFGTSRLFWNQGDGTFVDGTQAAGVGTDENGMGSTFGDYDGDGDLDWFVTSINSARCAGDPACVWDETGNRLYRNEGRRRFMDVSLQTGVRDGGWAWGAAFFDPDADGHLDLVVTSGFDVPRSPADDIFAMGQMYLFRGSGSAGRMSDIAADARIRSTGQGRGLCVFDADGDGDEDVFVVEQGQGGRLFRNETEDAGGWLAVRALGAGGMGAAYGAKVRVTVEAGGDIQLREVGVGAHFLCGLEPLVRFGVGDAMVIAEVEISWPDGTTSQLTDVEAGQILVVSPEE